MNAAPVAMFGLPGGTEWIVIALIALLVFGRRLPEVARSVGKSIVEFKKGIKDVHGDIEEQSRIEPPRTSQLEQKHDATPKDSTTDEPAKEAEATTESSHASN